MGADLAAGGSAHREQNRGGLQRRRRRGSGSGGCPASRRRTRRRLCWGPRRRRQRSPRRASSSSGPEREREQAKRAGAVTEGPGASRGAHSRSAKAARDRPRGFERQQVISLCETQLPESRRGNSTPGRGAQGQRLFQTRLSARRQRDYLCERSRRRAGLVCASRSMASGRPPSSACWGRPTHARTTLWPSGASRRRGQFS